MSAPHASSLCLIAVTANRNMRPTLKQKAAGVNKYSAGLQT
jgi:hypothetical protein